MEERKYWLIMWAMILSFGAIVGVIGFAGYASVQFGMADRGYEKQMMTGYSTPIWQKINDVTQRSN